MHKWIEIKRGRTATQQTETDGIRTEKRLREISQYRFKFCHDGPQTLIQLHTGNYTGFYSVPFAKWGRRLIDQSGSSHFETWSRAIPRQRSFVALSPCHLCTRCIPVRKKKRESMCSISAAHLNSEGPFLGQFLCRLQQICVDARASGSLGRFPPICHWPLATCFNCTVA